jgi:hypothetical protein
MSEARGVRAYEESTYEAVSDPGKLTAWWERTLPNQELEPVYYRAYKVEVTKRIKEGPRDLLTFKLVHEAGQPSQREFTVEFPIETNYAWPDLPSTAQLAKPGVTPYGFLFLSDAWAQRHQVNHESLAEIGPHKWPIAAEEDAEDAAEDDVDDDVVRVLEAMKNEAARKKLMSTLDQLTGVMPQERGSK